MSEGLLCAKPIPVKDLGLSYLRLSVGHRVFYTVIPFAAAFGRRTGMPVKAGLKIVTTQERRTPCRT